MAVVFVLLVEERFPQQDQRAFTAATSLRLKKYAPSAMNK